SCTDQAKVLRSRSCGLIRRSSSICTATASLDVSESLVGIDIVVRMRVQQTGEKVVSGLRSTA
ncbi:MAG: hypothetical protein ACKPEY_04145, partial [Planctomycetota bacterium]